MGRVLLALAILSLATAEAQAMEAAPGPGINVSNNHFSAVRVYAEDADGDLHYLGLVGTRQFELFDLPAEVTELGGFRIKVFPVYDDARSPREQLGIKTQEFTTDTAETVILMLDGDLTASAVWFDR